MSNMYVLFVYAWLVTKCIIVLLLLLFTTSDERCQPLYILLFTIIYYSNISTCMCHAFIVVALVVVRC